jgi:hopanoid biosynthesis associated RND transporter like protein HpnN
MGTGRMNFVLTGLRKALIFETTHPLLTLFLALALAALSIFYTVMDLKFLTSQKQLISPEHRLVQLSEAIDQFEDFDTFVVAVENQNTSRSLDFLRVLVPILEADHENYLQVFSRVDPKLIEPWALLYLEKKDLLALRDNLKEHHSLIENLARSPGLTNFFKQINIEMASKMVGELFTGFLDEKSQGDKEPMDLDFLIRTLREMKEWLDGKTSFTSPWASFFTKESWSGDSEGYFWTENKRYLLLFVTPAKKGSGFSKASYSLAALRKAIAQTQAAFPGIKVGVTGLEALDMDEMGVALHDMSFATLLSLAGLVVLLLLFWRGFRRPLAEIISLLVALCITFGLTTLFIGHLNILSVSFAPMLLGLGIDYGVHWISRYKEELEARGALKKEALQATMVKLGPGILLAGLSAALSFFPLVLTGFKGLMELGIICSIGLLMATVNTLCLLPAVILIFDRPKEREPLSLPPRQGRPLLRFTKGRVLLLLVLACTGLGFCLWGAGKVRFDLNMLRLQSKRAESVIWEKKLVGDSKRPSMYGVVLARSLEEVQKKTAALEVLPTVSEVQSVKSLLPLEQKEKIDLLRQMRPLLAEVGPLQASTDPIKLSELDEVFGRIRFKMLDSNHSQWGVNKPLEVQMSQVRDLIDQLRHHFHSMERSNLLYLLKTFEKALTQDFNDKLDLLQANVDATPMRVNDLPKTLLQRFVGKDSLYLIRVFPSENIWEPELLGKFVHDLRTVDPDAIGDPVTLYVFTKAFRDACIRAAIYAAVFIFALLLITFRNVISALMAMTPLIVGTVLTFGLMHAFRVDLNLANSIFLPLVVGAGVEYGIIIVQRWRQRREEKKDTVLPFSTGMGVILAGITTTVGFSSLTISDHQGLYSLGVLTTIGSLAILAAAILFLPALLQLSAGFKLTHPSPIPSSASEEGIDQKEESEIGGCPKNSLSKESRP